MPKTFSSGAQSFSGVSDLVILCAGEHDGERPARTSILPSLLQEITLTFWACTAAMGRTFLPEEDRDRGRRTGGCAESWLLGAQVCRQP